jgi:hypothetical protein
MFLQSQQQVYRVSPDELAKLITVKRPKRMPGVIGGLPWQPHDFVLPSRRFLPAVIFSIPQTQRHSHWGPDGLDPARSITVK